jgi:tryptophan synthase alpha chain
MADQAERDASSALAREPGTVPRSPASRKALAVYLMAGADAPELAEAAVEAGADLVEVGFPFSDPLADGPTIRRAAERALAAGMRTGACLDCLATIRGRLGPNTPLVPMTYAWLFESWGWERLEADARAAGATSMIVADLPAGERPELRRVQLVAPTSTDARIELAARQTDGWLYLVTLTGTTGPRRDLSSALEGLAARVRRAAPDGLPLYAGFGISSPEHARAAAAHADGVVVGSRALEVAEDGPAALRDYIRSLRRALDD